MEKDKEIAENIDLQIHIRDLETEVKSLKDERRELYNQIYSLVLKTNEMQIMCWNIAKERDEAKGKINKLERFKTLMEGETAAFQFVMEKLNNISDCTDDTGNI